MRKKFLPDFLDRSLKSLEKENLSESEQAHLISSTFSSSLDLLGKLALLEYSKCSAKSFLVYQTLKKTSYSSEPWWWISILSSVLEHLNNHGVLILQPLLNIREKYPSLQKKKEEDLVQKLMWFYCLHRVHNCTFSASEIEENKEYVSLFLEEFKFLASFSYQTIKEQTYIVQGQKNLSLSWFYRVQQDSKNFLWEVSDISQKTWEEFITSLKTSTNSTHKNEDFKVVDLPWLEVEIKDILSKYRASPVIASWTNPILVQGYPGTGKTSLASCMSRWFPEVKVHYQELLLENYRNNRAFLQQWLEDIRAQIVEKPLENIIILDSIENIHHDDLYMALEVLESLSVPIILICFQRQNSTATFEDCYEIKLLASDNIYYNQYFSEEKIASLKKQYLASEEAKEIFTFLSSHNCDIFYSAREVAEYLGLFTPTVEASLIQMSPLCEICQESPLKYRLFMPLCQHLLSSSTRKGL